MVNPTAAWALVTDGGSARIMSMKRYPPQFHQIYALDSLTRQSPSRELESDARGRSHHIRGPGSHTREPRMGAHDLAERRFVADLLERLDREVASGALEALVLAADPRTLGTIRKHMSRKLPDRVVVELNRDLTGLPADKLERRLREALDWPLERSVEIY